MRHVSSRSPRSRSVLLPAILALAAASCGGGDGATTPPPGGCDPGSTTAYAALGGLTNHVAVGTAVTYSSNPPSIGQHYSATLPRGTYASAQDPRQWVHNLEHGWIVFLYDCAACTDVELALRQFAESRPPDDGGAFRYVVSPFSGMDTRVAVVAWGQVYRSECVNTVEIDAFVDAHYRNAPEDVP